jgi:hypothetical protein
LLLTKANAGAPRKNIGGGAIGDTVASKYLILESLIRCKSSYYIVRKTSVHRRERVAEDPRTRPIHAPPWRHGSSETRPLCDAGAARRHSRDGTRSSGAHGGWRSSSPSRRCASLAGAVRRVRPQESYCAFCADGAWQSLGTRGTAGSRWPACRGCAHSVSSALRRHVEPSCASSEQMHARGPYHGQKVSRQVRTIPGAWCQPQRTM